jgi:para-nitrobenzyl esterase
VHGTNDSRARCPEQAGRNTRIRDIVLDFVTSDQTRLWPAATDRPTSGSAGILPL